ncbi:MAG: acetate--CoA ligase family protein [Deltaproteobacteria bacterium]|nr:acetate--CoA ligase family protein [Deltaproteobacteria bacterium]MBW2019229.1 acetate--CoA ligase family protein [Deltaproteobacteria bacterium]MBW2074035.1 acetate--CoA ligase family protein [Deltaproteobacteria bacterium]RLB82479.1 MAG: CoA-binding protein [Deltaproteobacteria bacterium]
MLQHFFNPSSVAVIGASQNPAKIGYDILNNILQYGYGGTVYPINPKAQEILGHKAYPDLASVPSDIDLAVVAVPATAVMDVLEQCGKKGVDSVIVVTAGFREIGPEGARLENKLAMRARELGIRIVGPNCLGIIDTASALNASFAAGMPLAGHIGFFSQSGALCVAILDWALGENVGFSRFVSLGNKMDISETEIMLSMGQDENTRVILGYLESIEDGPRFMKAAREVSKTKPIIIIKSGTTSAGAKAASSHTGALAGSDHAYRAAFKQSGIIHAESMQALFGYAMAFANQAPPKGPSLAIITNSGGPGILAADACDRSSLHLTPIRRETADRLREFLPPTASVYNPIDIIGDATHERYQKTLAVILNDEFIHAVLILLTPTAAVDAEAVAREIVSLAKDTDKPIMTAFMGGKRVRHARKIFQDHAIPAYDYPEDAVGALDAMLSYRRWREQPERQYRHFDVDTSKVREVFASVVKQHRQDLVESEARQILKAYGFRLPESRIARTTQEAVKMASEIGYPVVMKIASPDVLHKSDMGGVRVGVENEAMAEDAFFHITSNIQLRQPGARILGVMVQEMIPQGREVILGITRDMQFGPIIMFGLGGIYVEVLKDVAFRIAPLSVEEADAMIRDIRSFPLLRGVRGELPADIKGIRDALLRLSQMAIDCPEIVEADVNPLLVCPEGQGAVAVDARITIQE